MNELVLIASKDADFYMFLRHIFARGGLRTSMIDIAAHCEDADLRSAKAIVVDSCDDLGAVLTFCQSVRNRGAIADLPIIALVRARHEHFYLKLIQAGVDQCIMRPVAPELVVTCVVDLVTKATCPPEEATANQSMLQLDDVALDEQRRILVGGAGSRQLSPTQFRLLMRLIAEPGRVVSRDELIGAAWPGGNYVEPRTVDVHIGNLRRALHTLTGRKLIRTVRTAGFVLELGES